MNHLEEQTGIITKEEFLDMMRTKNADKFFRKGNGDDEYDTMPKDEYYLEGSGLLQVFGLHSEDRTKCVSVTVYADYNEKTGHFEPVVWFEFTQLVFIGEDGYDIWEFDEGMECKKEIDYSKDDCWEELEDYMRGLLTEVYKNV